MFVPRVVRLARVTDAFRDEKHFFVFFCRSLRCFIIQVLLTKPPANVLIFNMLSERELTGMDGMSCVVAKKAIRRTTTGPYLTQLISTTLSENETKAEVVYCAVSKGFILFYLKIYLGAAAVSVLLKDNSVEKLKVCLFLYFFGHSYP